MPLFSPTFILLVALIFTHMWRYRRSRKTLPPGPPSLPIIGNAHQMPKDTPQWIVFSQWYKKYGNLIHLNIIGQPIVVVNSVQVAKDLLDKRSTIYSDRPVMTMCQELVGFGAVFALQNYNEQYRKQRKIVAPLLGVGKVHRYYALQEQQAATLLHDLLQDPNALSSVVHHRITHIFMRLIYGYNAISKSDKMMLELIEVTRIFNKSATPGNFLVDSFPSLRHIPRWMPGSGFLDLADTWKAQMTKTAREMYEWCRDNLDTGKAQMPNFVGDMIQDQMDQSSEKQNVQLDNLMWAASGIMGGGADTSISAILSFMMAMVLHPEVQRKAHAELDKVIGNERLPLISDQNNLPYTRSIMIEVLRWASIAPLGIPHALSEDDIYEGYLIKKGTIIIPNSWYMLHDPEVYDAPMEFRPERFYSNEAESAKVLDIVFGFGRRVCPGKYTAQGTLFAVIVTTLATCHILPFKNDNGEDVLPKYAYTATPVAYPEQFSIEMKPRSDKASELLFEAANKEESPM